MESLDNTVIAEPTPGLKERIEALNGAINTVADQATVANQASSFQLTVEKELFELRSDLAGLDGRIASLEAANNVLNEQLNQTLTLLRDFEIDKTVRQALEAQINALTLKTKAGFEHLGVNVDNLSGRNRRS